MRDPKTQECTIRASVVLIGVQRLYQPGFVFVRGDRIVEVGPLGRRRRKRRGKLWELDGAIVTPGFINAHCHLDYTGLQGRLPRQSFSDWIRRIVEEKSKLTREGLVSAIRRGYELLLASGTTTVANIEAFPEILLEEKPLLRTIHFLELLDIRVSPWSEERLAGFWKSLLCQHSPMQRVGLAPHAPYTVSEHLYRLVARCADQLNLLWTTHVAESQEEYEMFRQAKGPLYELMRGLGRDCRDCGKTSPLGVLAKQGILSPRAILVHANYLQKEDQDTVVQSGATLVHCPKSHAFFGHDAFPLTEWTSLGVPVLLGTDSLASNDTLDLREEIRLARRIHPGIAPAQWWWMVTGKAGKILQKKPSLGTIETGAVADLVAFPWEPGEDPWECVIEGKTPPRLVMVGGNVLVAPDS
ncbi:amidohydrolase family protein [Candidatus Methylacidithermus pantelleriae]|uniref:amidohydrolase family protein n=1 Tax=Candidatus Methylacidithermus pantelleriae TaxID=2744239 RepID=UPI00157CE2B5|nr:amidohydrolase family protein [Candidatus Methylacidithermus pantelleriae]